MKYLSREHSVTTLRPENPAAISIESGEELMVETWDAFTGIRDASVLVADSLVAKATGPIEVNGARPGDAIKIDFLGIKPKGEAVHMVIPGRGFLEAEFTEAYPTIMNYEEGHVVFPNGLRFPMSPSVGFVATTPTYAQTTASDSGPYGGDIDMKELIAGSTLYLPVLVPGGMLTFGDCHAVIGDGAVAGTGAETSSDIHVRITIEEGMDIASPRALTPEYFVVLSHGEELGPAMKQAVRGMVDFLVQEKGMPPYDAYTLLSIAADVRVSRSFRPISPVKMMLARAALEQL